MPDVSALSSRRAVLAATIGAAAAWLAGAAGRVPAVRAGVDGDVVLGAANTASGITTISNATGDGLIGRSGAAATSGLWGDNSGGGYGVAGSTSSATTAGVWGSNAGTGHGVRGTCYDGIAVFAESTRGRGVEGRSNRQAGVYGVSSLWNGVHGVSGSSSDSGVWGDNVSGGYGVAGSTSSAAAAGVVGSNGDRGPGVLGNSPLGIGVRAQSSAGYALDVDGKAHFSHSGRDAIAAGKRSVKINLGATTPSSMVFATLAKNVSGRYVVAAVPANGSFTIYLNANLLVSAPVVWFVLDF